jgi:hypothetical protein
MKTYYRITNKTQVYWRNHYHNHEKHEDLKNTKKRAIFSYCGKEVRQITKHFKNTQLKIHFGTKITINNVLKYHTQTDKYNSSCMYQMKYLYCPMKYAGQTRRTFNIKNIFVLSEIIIVISSIQVTYQTRVTQTAQ